MMLQSESVDDELEHFEDITEETDNQPSTALNKQVADNGAIQNGDDANSDSDDANSDSDSSEAEEEDHPAASSESDDDDSDDAEFLLSRNYTDIKKSKSASDDEGQESKVSSKKSSLPGGYDPRHREPSYCNADRVSWWELMVLASHAHPSVATMARTLLSGANIVYNGNPLNDLSLTAFLDKFMEKKPKQSTWHGGSQIEPTKKMNVNNLLIGPEILSLAEVDVPPEDLVFHKFYANKMNSSKKPKKKKKKTADEEAAEDLYEVDGVDGSDESDNDEIENLLDSANPSLEPDGDYDYDDLDKVANEDDEDLIGDVSDAEIDMPSDVGEDDSDVADASVDDGGNDDKGGFDIGDFDDGSDVDEDEVEEVDTGKRKRKTGGKSTVSPFASYEDYEHLMEEDDQTEKEPTQRTRKSKKRKN